MGSSEKLRLVSTEVGCLWTQYMNDTMEVCTLKYFLNKVQDDEIRPVIEYALDLSEKHIESITQIFGNEGIPIPVGYTKDDVNLDAPPLYLDSFYLRYLQQIAKLGLMAYGFSSAAVVRQDVRNFFYDCTKSYLELNEQVIQVLLSKGLFIRAPYIPIPQQVEFAQSPSFLGSVLTENRPLSAMSLTHLFPNIQANAVDRALLIGFSQVAKSDDIRQYFLRGQEIAKKHIDVFTTLFKDDDLSVPGTFDSEVTNSTVAPFSDKLMMQHVITLTGAGIANYGAGISTSIRADVVTNYVRLMGEIADYGEDGAQLMIKHGWLEQPPQAADRKELALQR